MRRSWVLALVGVTVLTAASSARALVAIMPGPGPNRVATADAVVVGRVIALEDKDIETTAGPTGGKVTYRIALVTVTENLFGVKDAKTVRVGFTPVKDPAGGGVIGIRPRPGIGLPVNLEVGKDGLFFLTKHFKEDFYFVQFNDMLPRSDASFEKTLEDTKRSAKVFANPIEALKAGTPEDRFQACTALITKYRQPRSTSGKTELISAEESKLILKALREGRWGGTAVRPPIGGFAPDAWNLFNQLGLQAKDGWTPMGKTIADLHKAAQDWLDKNMDTYRIARLIPDGGTAGGGGVIRDVDPVVPIRPIPMPIKKIKLKPLPIKPVDM